ncbi:MAG: hypothetical protein HPY68_10150 [Candidatus Atribacteria bacterium]|nr:hypothetical protein [Candidatus Atribacteria bacterium]
MAGSSSSGTPIQVERWTTAATCTLIDDMEPMLALAKARQGIGEHSGRYRG